MAVGEFWLGCTHCSPCNLPNGFPGGPVSASQPPSLPYSLSFPLLPKHLRVTGSHSPTLSPLTLYSFAGGTGLLTQGRSSGTEKTTSLDLKAAPGSLCSVQAVDKSVLLKENNTLTANTVSAACGDQPPSVCLPSASMHWWEETHSPSQDTAAVLGGCPGIPPPRPLLSRYVVIMFLMHQPCTVGLCLEHGGCCTALQG